MMRFKCSNAFYYDESDKIMQEAENGYAYM